MQLNNTKESREIKTEYLKIHGNCMEFKDTIIQLSNVSLISSEKLSLTSFPIWAAVLIALGVSALLTRGGLAKFGIILIICGGFGVYYWYRQNERAQQLERLLITTNSGHTFAIIFNNRPFLSKVVETLKEIVAYPGHLSDVTVNVKNNTLNYNDESVNIVGNKISGGSSAIHDYQKTNSK